MIGAVDLTQWAIFLGTIIPLVASATVAIIREIRAGHAELHRQLRLPSNGTTIGAGVEAIGQKQDLAIGLAHPETDAPSFVQMARNLAPADPSIAPQRRTDDPPTETSSP